jgi:hypothetical protein
MATRHRAELRKIRTFPSLVSYLRDEMGWPIDSADFEELTFDYTPEELGIDPASAAKIQEIKRLRPLTANQPWGIFFVKFEPKTLPVVALRRILSRVVLKKRASANSAERAAWEVDDLLFVSNFGQGQQRQISFAHFSHEGAKSELPTLKVLGWDSSDTPLKLDAVADKLTDNLAWPTDEADVATWRESWRSAFTLRHGEVVTTSKALAVRLAELARSIRDRIKTVLEIETDDGPITKLMKTFQASLVHDLDAEGFADMYAQTIAYGLLSARIENPGSDTADDFATHMRTSPFLRELMESFLSTGVRQTNGDVDSALDFDELGVNDVVDLLDAVNMEAVVRDFGDTNPLEDPVVHFYELFLKEYDAKKRMQRGVFYTPRPVVSFIVRSVHELLQTEFGLPDGLADTATWEQMVKRHPDLQLPKGVAPADRFVTVLDPATGTGTFLVEAIDVIHRTLLERWTAEGRGERESADLWNDYVPEHLLPRLHGYELLMAPYAIAHLKIGLKLYETGYQFGSAERARVYLTNALEPAHDFSGQFAFAIPALAHESQAVNEVKKRQRFTVIIGNPPYSFATANDSKYAIALVDPYRSVDGEPIRERAPLVLERALQDDYVKFTALAGSLVGTSTAGLVGVITNAAYLSTPYLRGMRNALLHDNSSISVLDLGGDAKEAATDENVFDIRQPVAVTLASRRPGDGRTFRFNRLRGSRRSKYTSLLESGGAVPIPEAPIPVAPAYAFKADGGPVEAEYLRFTSIVDLFIEKTTGVKTNRDGLVLGNDARELRGKLDTFTDRSVGDSEIADQLGAKTNAQWDMPRARRDLRGTIKDDLFGEADYRPFDTRAIYYDGRLISNPRPLLQRSVWKRDNICLISVRRVRTGDWAHSWVCGRVPLAEVISSADNCHVFPLYQYEDSGGALLDASRARVANLRVPGRTCIPAETFFSAVYALLWSEAYRDRYGRFLTDDYPRVPLFMPDALVTRLSTLGGQLVDLHLLKTPVGECATPDYFGPMPGLVEAVGYDDEVVWLSKDRTRGFRPVPEAVWLERVGRYQVCEKWLKDRKGQALSKHDIAAYRGIIGALSKTISLVKEIDGVIDAHGGWPGAFQSNGADSAQHQPALDV